MTTKAYIVISSEGSYEEYCTHYEKVFRRKDEADENEFEACQSKRNADKRNYLLAYINSHGKRTYSMEDVLHQEIYEDNRQFEWNPCEVMEIDFVEDLCVCKLKRKEQC